ncbi:g9178 [Coccomyxa elongata]
MEFPKVLKPAFSVGQSPIRRWTPLDWHTTIGRVARHFDVKEPITISALLRKDGGHVLRSWLEKTMPEVVIMDPDDATKESYTLPIVEAIEVSEDGKGYIQVPWQRATLGAIKRHTIECQVANYFSDAVLPMVSSIAEKLKTQLKGVTLTFSDTEVAHGEHRLFPGRGRVKSDRMIDDFLFIVEWTAKAPRPPVFSEDGTIHWPDLGVWAPEIAVLVSNIIKLLHARANLLDNARLQVALHFVVWGLGMLSPFPFGFGNKADDIRVWDVALGLMSMQPCRCNIQTYMFG